MGLSDLTMGVLLGAVLAGVLWQFVPPVVAVVVALILGGSVAVAASSSRPRSEDISRSETGDGREAPPQS